MRAAVWVVGIWLGCSALFLLGWICRGITIGPCDDCREWKRLADELGDQLVDRLAERDKAEAALADLHDQIPNVFLAGQVFQAERKDADL